MIFIRYLVKRLQPVAVGAVSGVVALPGNANRDAQTRTEKRPRQAGDVGEALGKPFRIIKPMTP
jgi:hypothetical protein